MSDRYKIEIIDYKDVGNAFGIIDKTKLANAIELLANDYDAKGYSFTRFENLSGNGMLNCVLVFEKYDFDK